MFKLNSILFISTGNSEGKINPESLSDLKIANDVKVVENVGEGIFYLNQYLKKHGHFCPELIFLDLKDLLKSGIEFLESFSTLFIENKEQVRIIFMTSEADHKEAATLKALGDFEFLERPFTEESLFNCLISVHSF